MKLSISFDVRNLRLAASDDALAESVPYNACFQFGRLTWLTSPVPSLADHLIDVLALRRPPLAGTLHLDGENLFALGREEAGRWRHRTLRLIDPASDTLPPGRTVLQAIQTALAECEPQSSIPRTIDLIERFGLRRHLCERVRALDEGERLLVQAALAIGASPRVLLIKSCPTQLDSALVEKILAVLRRHAQVRPGLVLISYEFGGIPQIGDDIICIKPNKSQQKSAK